MADEDLATQWKDLLTLQKSESIKRRSPSSKSQIHRSPSKSQFFKSDINKGSRNDNKFTEYEEKNEVSKSAITKKLDYDKYNNYVIEEDPR